jgi:NADH:ubiquinone oxidoreductase subunit 6 (subunit J)
VIAWALIDAFGNNMIEPFESTATTDLSVLLFDRFVVPFEVVSFVLLAALIGGIAIARKDDEALS